MDRDELIERMGLAVKKAGEDWLRAQPTAKGSYAIPAEVTAAAALQSIDQAGFVIVPREPTEAMIEAGRKSAQGRATLTIMTKAVWPAMIEVGKVR